MPRPAILRRCSMRCWKRRCAVRARLSACFATYDGERFRSGRLTVSRRLSPSSCEQLADPVTRTAFRTLLTRASVRPRCRHAWPTRHYRSATRTAARSSISAARAPALACRCARTMRFSAFRRLSPGGAAVLGQADRAAAELRRAGGDRDGERAADHRDSARRWSSRPRPPRCCR